MEDYGKFSPEDQKKLLDAHEKILKSQVIPAYQRLIQGLESLRGTGVSSRGLAHFQAEKNIMNIWAILAGVFLYSRYHKTSFHRYLYIGLYGTSLSPIMTQIMQIGHLPVYARVLISLGGGDQHWFCAPAFKYPCPLCAQWIFPL